jgi:Cu/Ag efflux pump CusA
MRILDVAARVEGRDASAVLADVRSHVAAISFPLEHHAEVRGVSAERQADQLRLLAAMLAAAIGIFLLLQAAFGSWRLAALTFVTLPAALAGGLVAGLVAGGGSLTLGAFVGLLAVLALAARNGIVLIAHVQQLALADGEATRIDLALRGARDRLAPTLLTAGATAVAVLPFVLLGDVPGFEILRPMAVTILGGLVTLTLLALFVIPAVFVGSGGAETARTAQPAELPALSHA